jgi:hypothetical protein
MREAKIANEELPPCNAFDGKQHQELLKHIKFIFNLQSNAKKSMRDH